MPINAKDYALVIGLNDYPDYGGGGRSLKGAINDAEEVAEWLWDKVAGGGLPDDHVKRILSRADPLAPDQRDIDKALKEIASEAKETGGRRLYFYFSGHGHVSGHSHLDVALCLPHWSRDNRNAALSSRLYFDYILKCSPFTETVMLLDCCRVKEVAAIGKPSDLDCPVPCGRKRKTIIAYASDFLGSAFEGPDAAGQEVRGHFTRALLAGLRGGAARREGSVTARALKRYLEKHVRCIAETAGHIQEPRVVLDLTDDDAETMVFGSALPEANVEITFGANRNDLINLRRPTADVPTGRQSFEVTVAQGNRGLQSAETHITVRDGWEKIGEGYGNLNLDLPRGLYTVHLERGGATHEEVVQHPASSTLKFQEPVRQSALPAYDTADSHEYYNDKAKGLSSKDTASAAVVFGTQDPCSSRLFIFVRAAAAGRQGTNRDLAEALFLCDLAGNRLTDFAPEVVERSESDGWVGFSAPAPAGSYIFCYAGLEPQQIALTVFSGWETQFFVPFAERPQLARGSLLLAPHGTGFCPNDRLAQATDAGLAGLQIGVNLLPPELYDAVLCGEFDNPMLGLVGAHLFLLEPSPHWNRLETMIDKLEHLLPRAADVQALRLALACRRGKKPPVRPVPVPPMLRRGLDAVLEASAIDPDIVPEGSITERIAPYLLANTQWSMWSPPVSLNGLSSEATREEVSRRAVERADDALKDLSLDTMGNEQLNAMLEQQFEELLTQLGLDEPGTVVRGRDQTSSRDATKMLNDARQNGASTVPEVAGKIMVEGIDAALRTQPERMPIPPGGAEVPTWVRHLLEDVRDRAGKPDLPSVARRAKLPLGMLLRAAGPKGRG